MQSSKKIQKMLFAGEPISSKASNRNAVEDVKQIGKAIINCVLNPSMTILI